MLAGEKTDIHVCCFSWSYEDMFIFLRSETNLPEKKRKKYECRLLPKILVHLTPPQGSFLNTISLCPITETATYLRLVRVIIQLSLTTTMVFNDSSNKE